MAIKITDNFQVNIKNPIDNRFVVGSQSIPGGTGSIYPTPFYAYRDDISSNMGFVYPGLRIWDFNANLPYVWTGTTWSNENLTGASVFGSGSPTFTPSGGYRNYVTKFYDTGTVLTKSLLYDDYDHVSVVNLTTGLVTGGTNPNNSGGAGTPQLADSSASIKYGLHVEGRIRTNNGFVGNGSYIHNINAQNINGGPGSGGRLQLQWINTNTLGPANSSPTNTNPRYVLTTNGSNLTTSWQDILNVAPVYSPNSLGLGNSGAISLYSGTNTSSQLYEFFSLVSTGLSITDGNTGGGSVRLELNARSVGSTDGTPVYKGLIGANHEFRRIKSDTLKVSVDSSDNLVIESPEAGSSRALYVNVTYIPTYDDWKRAYDQQNLPGAIAGRFLSATGYYRGDGTQARPFTNSIKYNLGTPGVPGSLVGTIQNSAIQNGMDFYENEFGTTGGNRWYPSYAYETITIQGKTTYFYGGDFNYRFLRLKIECTNLISTTTGYLIDLDDTVKFAPGKLFTWQWSTWPTYDPVTNPTSDPNGPKAYIGAQVDISIDKDCQLEIRGSLIPGISGQPGYNYEGGASVSYKGGRGFRCSGSDISTTNYSGDYHQINLSGEGSILSLYKPIVPSSGPYGPSRQQNDNLFLFNLDENNNLVSTHPERPGGPSVIGYNNDGHIGINVTCNVTTRYQGIYMIGGKSKIEFTKGVGTGQLTDNLFGSTGYPAVPVGYLHDNDCYYAKGGLIRFFDAKISVSSGTRKSYFIVEPDLTKQFWDPLNADGTTIGGGYGRITGSTPIFIFRNCRLGGPSVNLFDKRTSGVAYVDMLNCTSLYFSAYNLVQTSTTGAPTILGGNGGENWSGTVDQRWGCQWNPAVGWSSSVQTGVANGGKFNGVFTFKNNVLQDIRYDPYFVDLTNSNGVSTINTIGSQVVNTLQRFDSVATAVSVNFQLQRGSQFIYVIYIPITSLINGKSYMIANAGTLGNTQWVTRGYNVTKLGIPAPYKMFNCTYSGTLGALSGGAQAYEIKIDFIP